MPFNYYPSLPSSSLKPPLDLALAGQPLALYCTFSSDRSKRVTLTHFDDTRPTELETEASDFALGVILSQLCEDKKWHPIECPSREFSPAEKNYNINDVRTLR